MAKNQLAVITSLAAIGIISYFGYKIFKELDTMYLMDFIGENIDDLYHYRIPKK